MRIKFDEGNFISDLRETIEDAKAKQPALIVVATEREVKTFERHFKDELDGEFVWCCSFSDYYTGRWMSAVPRPQHIYIFRVDDMVRNLSADAYVEYVTVVGRKRAEKKEENNDIQ